MRKLLLIIVLASFLYGCNKISNKSILIPLEQKELSNAIKQNDKFTDYYSKIRKVVQMMGDVDKAKYGDITYRKFFEFIRFQNDTTFWNPLYEKWEQEHAKIYTLYPSKLDSVIEYWTNYYKENSLDSYVKIELVEIKAIYDKRHYDWVDDVILSFKLTPIKGSIEMIKFNYCFRNKTDYKDLKGYCEIINPFDRDYIVYKKVQYRDDGKEIYAKYNAETFLKAYDCFFEVESIVKDGVFIKKDDIKIPQSMKKRIDWMKKFDYMEGLYDDDIIKELIDRKYITESEYKSNKQDSIIKKKNCENCQTLELVVKYIDFFKED